MPALIFLTLLIAVPVLITVLRGAPALDGVRGALVGAATLGGGGLWLWSLRRFQEQRTTVLMYDLEPDAEAACDALFQAFVALGDCQRGWTILTRAGISDWKRNAGANAVVERKAHQLGVMDPPRIMTNVSVPAIRTAGKSLYFLPDRLLVEQHGRFASVGYETIRVDVSTGRFIEEHPPGDATIVDHTWRYVNKSGGPDRRFSNNGKIPVCAYTHVHITSSTGLDEMFMFSRPHLNVPLQTAVTRLARVLSQPAGPAQSASTEPIPEETGGGQIAVAIRSPAAWVSVGAIVGSFLGAWGEAGMSTPGTVSASGVSGQYAPESVHLTWERDGLRVEVKPPGPYELGLAETAAAKGSGWMREACDTKGRVCHAVENGQVFLKSTRKVDDVKRGVTLFNHDHRGQLTILLRDGTHCWAGGDDPSFYTALGCGSVRVVEP